MFSQNRQIIFAGLLILLAQFGAAYAQQGAKSVVFVDFVVMKQGYGLKERDIYDARATPIANQHGIKRFASLDVMQNMTMKGFKAKRLDLWLLPSVKSLQALASDAAYRTLLPYRDKVHDMRALSLYFATPALPLKYIGKGHYFIELMRAGPGFDRNAFAAYEQQSDRIASAYGIQRIGSLNIAKKIQGAGPDGQRLNIWKLTNEKTFLAWGRSAEFKKLSPLRRKLFDQSSYLMIVAKSD